MTTKHNDLWQAGSVIEVDYPFYLETVSLSDPEGGPSISTKSWRPGTYFEEVTVDTSDSFADGLGKQIITVISIHKPGQYPTRVFFTRKWRDPRGKVFGKQRLHNLSIGVFRGLLRGYRHSFRIKPNIGHLGGEYIAPCHGREASITLVVPAGKLVLPAGKFT